MQRITPASDGTTRHVWPQYTSHAGHAGIRTESNAGRRAAAPVGLVPVLIGTAVIGVVVLCIFLPGSSRRRPTGGLLSTDFRSVASGGAGDPANDYGWGAAAVGNTVYVGTNRYHLCQMFSALVGMLNISLPLSIDVPCPPHPAGSRELAESLAGRIYACCIDTPPGGNCTEVHRSPVVWHAGGIWGAGPFSPPAGWYPVSYGYRSLTAHRGKIWALGVGTFHPYIAGVSVFASPDGGSGTWTDVTNNLHSVPLVQPREFFVWNGDLCFTAPAPVDPTNPLFSQFPTIQCTVDAVTPYWKNRVNAADFLAGGNTDLLYAEPWPAAGLLCVSTRNFATGFEVHCTDGTMHNETYVFRTLLSGGLGDADNQLGMTLTAVGNRLYVGTGTALGIVVGPSGISSMAKGWELGRIGTDGSAELVIGSALARRMTSLEIRLPVSGIGSGYWNPLSPYAWQITVHSDGWIYLGTYDSIGPIIRYGYPFLEAVMCDRASMEGLVGQVLRNGALKSELCAFGTQLSSSILMMASAVERGRRAVCAAGMAAHFVRTVTCRPGVLSLLRVLPCTAARSLARRLVFGFADAYGGADMIKSKDGVTWVPVTLDGMGNPLTIGFRRIISSSGRLIVSTASLYPELPGGGFSLLVAG